MIASLHISNYALIDRLDVDLPGGFSVLTGETGAGKSIIIGALGLLLGERAEVRVVRTPGQKSVVEGVFTGIGGDEWLMQFFKDNGLDWDSECCVVRREVTVGANDTGRSRAFINDTPVPVARLRDLGMHLVDIHSQHNNRLLQDESFQISLLDAIAEDADGVREYRRRYTTLKKTLALYRKATKEAQRVRADESELRQMLEELSRLRPVEGEYSQLEHEHRVLTDTAALRENAVIASEALGGSNGAIRGIREAIRAADRFADVLNADDRVAERLESLLVETEDLLATINQFREGLDDNPRYLAYLEERLDAYNMMARRLSTTPDGLALVQKQFQSRLDKLDNSDAELGKLRAALRSDKDAAKEAAKRLTRGRIAAAEYFKKEILGACRPPGMPNLAVDIKVEPTDLGASGADKVTFMFAFNKAQELMSVGSTASGGEISRLMLAIKAIVADRMSLPVMIFDEIDTGVSGNIAAGMGRMMRNISARGDTQVLAITHLPQVAACASGHYKVYKKDTDAATLTSITRLDEKQRVEEIAMMLSGRSCDETAMAAARSLLASDV